MKKIITIVALAMLLCLAISVALAAEQQYLGTVYVYQLEDLLDDSPALGDSPAITLSKVNPDTIVSIGGDASYAGTSLSYAQWKALGAKYPHDQKVDIVLEGVNANGQREKVYGQLAIHYAGAFDETASNDPTCSKGGIFVFDCACPGCKGTYTYTIDKDPSAHNLKQVKVAATCSAEGYTQLVCQDCDYKSAKTVLPKDPENGHVWKVTKAKDFVCSATTQLVPAVDELKATWSCSKCSAKPTTTTHYEQIKATLADDTIIEDSEFGAGWVPESYDEWIAVFGLDKDYDGHNWSVGKDVPATCITRSGHENICLNCHAVVLIENTTKDDRLSANLVLVPGQYVDCMTTEVEVYCSLCKGAYADAQYGADRAPIHKVHTVTPGEYRFNDLTLKDEEYWDFAHGITNADIATEVLGVVFTDYNEDGKGFVFVGSHRLNQYDEIEAEEGTYAHCVDPILGLYHCDWCWENVTLAVSAAPGHNFKDGWKLANSTSEIWVWKETCDDCGFVVTEATAKNHEPCADTDNDGKIDHAYVVDDKTKVTACNTEYTLPATCSVCGAKTDAYKFTTPDHDYKPFGDPIKAATCTETGLQKEICAFCGMSHDKVLPKTEHVKGTPIVTPATTEKEGSEVIKCKNCGEVLETKVLPKLVPELPAAKYEVKDAEYDGEAVSGKVEHVKDTKELANAYARVTFFYADGTFAVMVVPVEDGEFYAGATTATVHVAVQIVDNAKQITPPAESAIYGNAPAKMK